MEFGKQAHIDFYKYRNIYHTLKSLPVGFIINNFLVTTVPTFTSKSILGFVVNGAKDK